MMRLQKIIAQAGIASRRSAEELIKLGKVFVNGKKATIGDKASYEDEIVVDGKVLNHEEQKVYFVLNKPSRVITSAKDPQGRETVLDYIDEKERVFPVGRLDYDTTGVLLLTNDGNLAHRLTHPSFEILRVYRARINRSLTHEELKFLNGNKVMINNKKSTQEVVKADKKAYIITLHQGTFHHVKKLFEQVDTEVIKLTRIEYGGIGIENLPRGKYRRLNVKEVRSLKLLTKII